MYNSKLFNFSWNNNGQYIVMIGDNNYELKRDHLKFWIRHIVELVLEILQDISEEKEKVKE